MAKKTTVKELEVGVLLLTALRYHYVTRLLTSSPCVSLQIRCSVQQVLEGLRYLHQKNIAHLDIKVCPPHVVPSQNDLIKIVFTNTLHCLFFYVFLGEPPL